VLVLIRELPGLDGFTAVLLILAIVVDFVGLASLVSRLARGQQHPSGVHLDDEVSSVPVTS